MEGAQKNRLCFQGFFIVLSTGLFLSGLFSGRLSADSVNVNFSKSAGSVERPGYGLLGQGANIWNLSNSASATGLLDASGTATSIGYSYSPLNGFNQNDAWGPDDLLNQGLFNLNDLATVGSLTINGLIPDEPYSLIIYHSEMWAIETITANALPPTDFKKSTTSLAGEVYSDAYDRIRESNFWYYDRIRADDRGEIRVNTEGRGHDVITGFQIDRIPEPSIVLASLFATALMTLRRTDPGLLS